MANKFLIVQALLKLHGGLLLGSSQGMVVYLKPSREGIVRWFWNRKLYAYSAEEVLDLEMIKSVYGDPDWIIFRGNSGMRVVLELRKMDFKAVFDMLSEMYGHLYGESPGRVLWVTKPEWHGWRRKAPLPPRLEVHIC